MASNVYTVYKGYADEVRALATQMEADADRTALLEAEVEKYRGMFQNVRGALEQTCRHFAKSQAENERLREACRMSFRALKAKSDLANEAKGPWTRDDHYAYLALEKVMDATLRGEPPESEGQR